MKNISKDILAAAAEGDVSAFSQIYQAASLFVYNTALRITFNREDAQEITQDVFLKIYNQLRNFRFGSSFKTWLYRITVNTALNAVKRRAKRIRGQIEYKDEVALSVRYQKEIETTEQTYNAQLVQSMLGSLNEKQRVCIILREFEEMSYQEMAETLKININTVRSRLKRARQALLRMVKNKERLQCSVEK